VNLGFGALKDMKNLDYSVDFDKIQGDLAKDNVTLVSAYSIIDPSSDRKEKTPAQKLNATVKDPTDWDVYVEAQNKMTKGFVLDPFHSNFTKYVQDTFNKKKTFTSFWVPRNEPRIDSVISFNNTQKNYDDLILVPGSATRSKLDNMTLPMSAKLGDSKTDHYNLHSLYGAKFAKEMCHSHEDPNVKPFVISESTFPLNNASFSHLTPGKQNATFKDLQYVLSNIINFSVRIHHFNIRRCLASHPQGLVSAEKEKSSRSTRKSVPVTSKWQLPLHSQHTPTVPSPSLSASKLDSKNPSRLL